MVASFLPLQWKGLVPLLTWWITEDPLGGEVIAHAFTQDVSQGRRLVHADLLAMINADKSWDGSQGSTPCGWPSILNRALCAWGPRWPSK